MYGISSSLKKIGIISVLGLSLSVSACTPGNNTGGATVAGAAAGGLLGAAVFNGPAAWIGILGGALIGGLVGNQIGQYMDRQDQMNMQTAIANTPVGEQASWTNNNSHVDYTVTPVRDFHQSGYRYCREYQTKIRINGQLKQAYGRACMQPDGSWKVVK